MKLEKRKEKKKPTEADFALLSEIRSYLQTNRWANQSFTDAYRKHRTPGSEKRGFISHSTVGSMRVLFVLGPLTTQVP